MDGHPGVQKLSSISVVFPAYNDGGTIASMVTAAASACRQYADDFEIIVVNDGSSDYTAQVLAELKECYANLKVVTHPVNRGYGGALRSGFAVAQKDWIFYTDGDAQYNPLELDRLVNALNTGAAAVNGYKVTRSDPLLRIVVGRAYQHVTRFVFKFQVRDVDCDFRLIPRRILQQANLQSDSGAICLEMVKKIEDLGYTFAEVPVSHYPRLYGGSQFFRPARILRSLRQLVDLYKSLVIRKEYLRKE